MLKKDTIKANAVLAALTDDQIAAIEQLSQNDENTVIASKVGEIHRKYDETILKATGIQRSGDEKSYDYLARAGKELKEKSGSSEVLQAKITELETEKTRLKGIIDSGNVSEEFKTQLQQTKAELADTKTKYNQLQTNLTKKEKEHADALHGMQVDFEIGKATSSLKFKPEIPESASKVLLSQAIGQLKSNKAEFIDDGQGGRKLVFRNAEGAILNNPENQLNPYSASELLLKELKGMGVLDEQKKTTGGGTGAASKDKTCSSHIDISGAKTRVEANDIITKALMQNGLTRGSKEFSDASAEAWKENNVSELPEK